MPIPKIDPKKIFASQAPSQDVPAEFNNYERGWDESRKNNGKPTIKQFNKLQQLTDEKILWMHQNGAALPFDETMEYAEGAVVVKDGVLQQLKEGNWVDVFDGVTKDQLGLGNVDNTSDLDKPISLATQEALDLKANQDYVDSALTGLSFANKTYATLAAATADISNIAANQSVWVGSAAEGGLYEKKTADATSLTKSGYDPVVQAKGYTDGKLPSFSTRSGFIGGYTAANGLMLLGFRLSDGAPIFGKGGDISLRLDNLELVSEVRAIGRSGVIWGLKNPDGSLPIYIDKFTGKPILAGVDVLKKFETIDTTISSITGGTFGTPDFPDDNIAAWGDSLTGAGSSGDWPSKLAALNGRSVYNGGIGGQGSRQIAARNGGVPVRFSSFTIPAGTTPVSVTTNGWSPCSPGGAAIQITVAGIVGNLARAADGTHTFTRLSAGTSVNVTDGSIGVPSLGADYRKRIIIIGSGRNSFKNGSADFMSPAQIISTIRAMLDYQDTKVKRAIVWGIPPWPSETTGTALRNTLESVNSAIASAFPEQWLDIPAWLRTTSPQAIGSTTVNDPFTQLGITPTSQDLTDISNGITPISLRAGVDDGHFNQNAGTAIAYRMNIELQLRGWA